MLSTTNKVFLEKKGIKLIPQGQSYFILKEIGSAGNSIPYFKSIPLIEMNEKGETVKEIYSDCPTMILCYEKKLYKLTCWDWAPGPGPGDFDLKFEEENSLIDFITSYYFGTNEYFESRKRHTLQSRATINVKEVKSILNRLIAKLEKEFSTDEIEFGERGLFHKIPNDIWRMTKIEPEEPIIQVKTGFLENEIFNLRKKLDEDQAFNFEDYNNISDLIFELSLLLKEKAKK